MRLLIYDPWNCDSAAELSALIAHNNWRADWLDSTCLPRRNRSAPQSLRVEANLSEFREWVLLHERAARSHTGRKLARIRYDAFVGFGSASALLAATHSRAVLKIVFVDRMESQYFADVAMRSALIVSQLPFHQRVEFDLLRTFDRIIATRELAPRLADFGLTNFTIGGIHFLEKMLTNRAAA